LNLLIVFILCGLWHGSNWNFILWGMWHGIFLIFERLPSIRNIFSKKRYQIFTRIYTFFVIIIGWIIFKIESIPLLFSYLSKMFFRYNFIDSRSLFYFFNIKTLIVLGIAILVSQINFKIEKKQKLISILKSLLCMIVFLLAVIAISEGTHNPFIYFKF